MAIRDNTQSIERGAAALDKAKKALTPEQQRYIDRGYGIHLPQNPASKSRGRATSSRNPSAGYGRKIALGKAYLDSGDPGLGKSMLTVNFAAHVSTGGTGQRAGTHAHRATSCLFPQRMIPPIPSAHVWMQWVPILPGCTSLEGLKA